MSGRDTFTNPSVLKAEVELRYALAAYETACVSYKRYCTLYNVLLELYKDNDVVRSTADKISEKYDTLVNLQNIYDEKLNTYKLIIGF